MKVLRKGSGKSERVPSVGVDEAVVVAGYNAIEGVEAWSRSNTLARATRQQQKRRSLV